MRSLAFLQMFISLGLRRDAEALNSGDITALLQLHVRGTSPGALEEGPYHA